MVRQTNTYRMAQMNIQDWEPVILRTKNSTVATTKHGPKQIVEKRSAEGQRLAKIDREEYVKPKQLASESRKDLVAARVALKLTQDQLNQKCAFPPHTIKGFESGHLTPTGSHLNRLNRELKTSLHLE
jgi:ribosome-binding protein aMBF1 (putative translation factor)